MISFPVDIENLTPEVYGRDEHSISRKEIDPDALKIMYRLIRNGFKAYLVGGGVRDLLLGKRPKDFDIATDATPRRVKALFGNSRIIGRRFKLVHVFFGGGKVIEVSTFRDFSDPAEGEESEEGEISMLAPDNKYGTEVTDALRRDITINALFYDLSTFSIIDYVGGLKDLADRAIRVIGDPTQRFVEDPVRMLRVLRHAARASFSIERSAWDAIMEQRALICGCPKMRIFEELKKDMSSGYLYPIIRLLAQTQLLEQILPELSHEYANIFDERSDISRVLGANDRRARAGKAPALSVVLAILALFMRPGFRLKQSPEESVFASIEELEAHLATCFRVLAVPRRERERIEALLVGWFYLVRQAEGERRRVIERELAPDLAVLLQLLECDEALVRRAEAQAEGGSGGRRRRRR